MRIAFTGASGTGKTATANEFMGIIGGHPSVKQIIRVDARAILRKMGQTSVDKCSPSVYKQFQIAYVEEKIAAEQEADNYLCERSFCDCLAYWRLHNLNTSQDDQSAFLTRACLQYTMRYDIHFIFKNGRIPFAQDGYRHNDLDYHTSFERILEAVLAEANVTPVLVPPLSIAESARFVLGEIDALHRRGCRGNDSAEKGK